MTRIWTLALALALASACSRDDTAPAGDDGAETEASAEMEASEGDEDVAAAESDDAEAEEVGGDDDVPTPEDFEEEAQEGITAETLEAEIEALEGELGVDGEDE